MSESNPKCPRCNCEYSYADGALWICPECAHEWSPQPTAAENSEVGICDAHGNKLNDGDSVSVLKDLKIKGSSSVLKSGTKVKNIRVLKDAEDGHNISCRIEGIGQMNLKSEFVKKAN